MMLMGLVGLLALLVLAGGWWVVVRSAHLERDPGPSVLRDWVEQRAGATAARGG